VSHLTPSAPKSYGNLGNAIDAAEDLLMIRRRELIAGLGTAAAWPLTARAQQPGKLPTIGFLGPGHSSAAGPFIAPFLRRLRELGWVEGRNIAVEYRWTEGRREATEEFLAEFVRLKVDVIHTIGNVDALEAKEATSVIPIVGAFAGEPIRSGLVPSLARPGGNVTGLSSQYAETAGKRIELLREVAPGLRRLALMTAFAPEDVLTIGDVQAAAGTLGLEVIALEIRRTEDVAIAFDTLKGRAEAMYITTRVAAADRERIATLALGQRLPTISSLRSWPDAGGLMSYGANVSDLLRRSADMIDKILRGTKPADIPIEQPTKFELIINLKTAKALCLTIPPTLLAIADEVIE
jgi:putative ABC transport system substrate-binding protein